MTETRPDPLAAAAAAADVAYAQLVRDFQASPEQVAKRASEELERLENDPHRLGAALSTPAAKQEADRIRERARLAQFAANSSGEAAAFAMAEVRRIDQALAGQIDYLESNVTVGTQIPQKDFNSQVAHDLELGIRESMLKSFYATGRGDDPNGREAEIAAAKAWEQKLTNDPEMQRRLFAKDPEIMKQFRLYGMYAAGPEEIVEP